MPLTFSSNVGCNPVGVMNEDEKCCVVGWWRDGKEKSVAEGLVCSPITVRNPPRDSSSGSVGFETERTPTSRRDLVFCFWRSRSQLREGKKAVSVTAWEMVSKSISSDAAVFRRSILETQ